MRVAFILREEIPSIGRLEAQLKACLCRLVFSKAKVRIILRPTQLLNYKNVYIELQDRYVIIFFQPSVLALSVICQEFEALQSLAMLEIVQEVQRHLKVLYSLITDLSMYDMMVS